MNEEIMKQEDEMKIEDIINMFKKRWKILLITTVTITFLFAIVGIFMTHYNNITKHHFITRILIQKDDIEQKDNNNDEISMYKSLLGTYSDVIMTHDFVQKIIDNDNLDLTSDSILSMLYASQRPNTQILEIKYTNVDGELAREIDESVADEFLDTYKEIIPNVNAKVIQAATEIIDPKDNNNNIKYIAIGFSFGLMLSIGLVLILEIMSNKINKKKELEQMLKLPVIGSIPDEIHINKVAKTKINELKNSFIMEQMPKSLVAESYRTLRTNIQYSPSHNEMRSLVVTSPESSEGKSTICGNMAFAFAQDGKKVVLVDCDFRNPSLHKNFGIPNLVGLSDILERKASLEESIQKYSENIHLLPCGKIPENPSEMISLDVMDSLLKELKEKYNIIILDSPSIKTFTDAQVLSVKADGTLLIARAKKTKKESIIEAKNLLVKVGANVIGTVLNGSDNQ